MHERSSGSEPHAYTAVTCLHYVCGCSQSHY